MKFIANVSFDFIGECFSHAARFADKLLILSTTSPCWSICIQARIFLSLGKVNICWILWRNACYILNVQDYANWFCCFNESRRTVWDRTPFSLQLDHNGRSHRFSCDLNSFVSKVFAGWTSILYLCVKFSRL